MERLRPGAKSTEIKCGYLFKWIERPEGSWDLGRQILLSLASWKGCIGLDYKVNMKEISLKLEWVNEIKRKVIEM